MSLPQNGFVNGGWTTPLHGDPVTVLDPATEEPLGSVAGLGAGDVEAVCTSAVGAGSPRTSMSCRAASWALRCT